LPNGEPYDWSKANRSRKSRLRKWAQAWPLPLK
jgi:hypothetical protein